MASDISSGGSSDFLAARKYFRANSSSAKEEIEVFVEDEVDSVFWRYFFAKYESDKIFKIKVLRKENNELCGKESLITYVSLDSLGCNKLIAIDSDYDYIIDNYHTYTQEIRNCKYVIHTSDTYSIENYKITPSILRDAIYLTSFCEHITEDIDAMMREASQLFYNLFTIHLFSVARKDCKYIQSKFRSDLHNLTYQKEKISVKTKKYVSNRLKDYMLYINENRSEYDNFLSQLKSKGVEIENCWQFMNGHHVLDEIGVKIAAMISTKYRGEYLKWINSSITDITEQTRKDSLLRKFNNSTGVVDGKHQLKDRIRKILYDIKPDFFWDPSINNDSQIQDIFK